MQGTERASAAEICALNVDELVSSQESGDAIEFLSSNLRSCYF